MTFHQLQVFVTVAKHQSTTKASEELNLCQPAVCHQLKLLEEECGAKLYISKMGRGIELTDEGAIFFSEAQVVLQDFVRLKERFDRTPKKTSLTVGGSQQPCMGFLALALSRFKQSHPTVDVFLRNDRSRELERLVQNSEIELAVITESSFAPSLVYEKQGKAEIVLFVSPDHSSLGGKSKWVAKDLEGASLLCKRGRRTEEFLEHLAKQGVRFGGVTRCESAEAVRAMALRGMGVGSLYRDHVEADARTGTLRIIQGPQFKLIHPTAVIYRKDPPLSKNSQEFLALLRELEAKPPRFKKQAVGSEFLKA